MLLVFRPRLIKTGSVAIPTRVCKVNIAGLLRAILIHIFENRAAFAASLFHGQVVVPQDHILEMVLSGLLIFRFKICSAAKHMDMSLQLALFLRQWYVYQCLTVKVGIVGFTDQRMQPKELLLSIVKCLKA